MQTLNMNFDFQSTMGITGQTNAQCQSIANNSSFGNLQNMMIPNTIPQYCHVPAKLIKTSLYITSSNLPQNVKDSIIQNLLFNNPGFQNDQLNQSNLLLMNQQYITNMNSNGSSNMNLSFNHNQNQISNPRVLFKKEEDERIKKLVKVFGTRHWDLVAQFMEGRTAKQCRDRYSNYLIPGFFQGEWSDEEDSLLIKLYKENGPRWSVIQKSFKNRSANNIKNRWYYFLRKKVQILDDCDSIPENKYELKNSSDNEEKNANLGQKQPRTDEYTINNITEDRDFFQQENEIFDTFNCTFENEAEWLIFN